MQFPLVTRRHHDAQVLDLENQIDSLIDDVVALAQDQRTTKESLRIAVVTLHRTMTERDALAKKLERSETDRSYLYSQLGRESRHQYEPTCLPKFLFREQPQPVEPYWANRYSLMVDPMRIDFMCDRRERSSNDDWRHVREVVAAKMGTAYGETIRTHARQALGLLTEVA